MNYVTIAAVSGMCSSVTERNRFQNQTRIQNEINSTATLQIPKSLIDVTHWSERNIGIQICSLLFRNLSLLHFSRQVSQSFTRCGTAQADKRE